MARQDRDAEIDALYQLPLAEFIPARNALAKHAGADVRRLQKPTLPAWAVNQLYWKDRRAYDELVTRARDLRATHDAALRGKPGDVRGASRAHEEAVESALARTLALLAASGEPITDSTRQAIATTLSGLPSGDAPGRLVRPLQPRGFEMLSAALAPGRVRPASSGGRTAPATPAGSKTAARRLDAARRALETAGRARKEAEGLERREEFTAARASREADKALQRVAEAQQALEAAQAALAEAERAAAAAARGREQAQARAARAAQRAASARDREEAARAELEALQ